MWAARSEMFNNGRGAKDKQIESQVYLLTWPAGNWTQTCLPSCDLWKCLYWDSRAWISKFLVNKFPFRRRKWSRVSSATISSQKVLADDVLWWLNSLRSQLSRVNLSRLSRRKFNVFICLHDLWSFLKSFFSLQTLNNKLKIPHKKASLVLRASSDENSTDAPSLQFSNFRLIPNASNSKCIIFEE